MSSVSFRIDEQVKHEAFKVIEGFGLKPSDAMRLLLKQIANTRSLPITFEALPKEPNEQTIEAMLEARAIAKQMNGKKHYALKEMIALENVNESC